MIVSSLSKVPACSECGATPVVDRCGPEGHYQFFVICKSEACARRKDNGQMTVGRVLSNGKAIQADAEADWQKTAKARAEAKAQGY